MPGVPLARRYPRSSIVARLGSAAALLPLVTILLWLGGVAWVLFLAMLAAIAATELATIARHAGARPSMLLAPVLSAAIVLAAGVNSAPGASFILAATVLAAFAAQIVRPAEQRSLADWAIVVAVPTYVGLLTSYGVHLRHMPSGLAWTTALLLLVWSNDSAAYLAGRLLGRTPLAPALSPRKTWEGLVAGACATVVISVVLPRLAAAAPAWADAGGLADTPPLLLAAVGLVIALVAPLGDLSKSFLKREAGMKDASHLIPGHGGVLDRVDSLLFAAPVLYLVAYVVHFGRLPGS